MLARVESLGAAERARYWIGGNDVLVEVPAGAVAAITRLPEVIGVELSREDGSSLLAYSVWNTCPAGGGAAQYTAG